MAAAIEQKALASDTVSRVHADYTQTPTRQHLRLDERTDLTIEEAEKLARGRPFELIDGRLVFKYPEVLTQRESAARVTIEKYDSRAPDLTIEIASDDDTVAEVFAKARLYLETGSRVVWLIFPTEKRAMVLTPEEWRWESVELVCPELLPEFKLAVAALFQ